ncbi:HEAT repeat domain-containing protein [Yoonia sp. 2307UL14-13]|uniref:HEAT repeat domain-containing protein n=1 Tax=Yoonia sp. 2307UL14-13 TaxID=3126506 RepID=UPI003095E73D
MDMMTVFATWDGKTTAELKDVAASLTVDDHPTLLSACDAGGKTGRAATWVLKSAYESGASIAFPEDVLRGNPHWEVALHLLQSVKYAGARVAPESVRPFLDHKKPMVRAWALDAYVLLDGPDAAKYLRQASNDLAASVRARARNLRKK